MLEKLASYFEKDSIHHIPSYVFSDREIYDMEMKHIFSKSWLYVGHESEIPNNNDFVTRYMGELPVIVTRSESGSIEVLLNICSHRGMKLCRTESGNQKGFTCPYHGFTYRSNGELVGIPFQKIAYPPDFVKTGLGLRKARVETYKGLIFATFDHDAISLDEYLNDMKWYLDITLCRTDMEIVGPPQKFEVKCNWKIASENFITDAYHTAHTHASIVEVGIAPRPEFARFGHHVNMKYGHGLGIGTGAPGTPQILPADMMDEYRANLTEEQFETLKNMRNMHASIFPNLSFLVPTAKIEGEMISVLTLRIWLPKGPDKIEVQSFFMVEKNASKEWKRKSRQAYVLTFGSSGIFEQDDTENWADVTENVKALQALDDTFIFDSRMGLGMPAAEGFHGPGHEIYDGKFSEANSRAFYREWYNRLKQDKGSE